MNANLTLVFAIVLVLAIATAFARKHSPEGTRRNTLSVILVVLCLIAMFVFCFGLGTIARRPDAAAKAAAFSDSPLRASLRSATA